LRHWGVLQQVQLKIGVKRLFFRGARFGAEELQEQPGGSGGRDATHYHFLVRGM